MWTMSKSKNCLKMKRKLLQLTQLLSMTKNGNYKRQVPCEKAMLSNPPLQVISECCPSSSAAGLQAEHQGGEALVPEQHSLSGQRQSDTTVL